MIRAKVGVIDGEHDGDGGTVSRRSGRHAAPAVGGRTSAHGLRARVVALLVTGLAWLFERRSRVLILAVTVVVVAVIGGAISARSFAGAPQALDEPADVVSTTRPTSTAPAEPTNYAPILPSPGAPPSVSPASPAPPRRAAEPTAEPTPIAQPGRETAPAATNPPAAVDPPRETKAPADPEDPEDCVEQRGFLELLLLGPSCP